MPSCPFGWAAPRFDAGERMQKVRPSAESTPSLVDASATTPAAVRVTWATEGVQADAPKQVSRTKMCVSS